MINPPYFTPGIQLHSALFDAYDTTYFRPLTTRLATKGPSPHPDTSRRTTKAGHTHPFPNMYPTEVQTLYYIIIEAK